MRAVVRSTSASAAKAARRLAQVGIQTELARGSEIIRDLDVIVAVALEDDPARLAAWRSARLVEGQGTSPASAPKVALPVPVAAPPAPSSIDPPVILEPAVVTAPASPPAVPAPPMEEAAIGEHEAPLQKAS